MAKNRNIVTLQFGRGGCHLGHAMWKQISEEHCLEPGTGLFVGTENIYCERLPVFFTECSGRYVPRTLFIDSDPVPLNEIASTTWGANYSPEHFLPGRAGAANNFAKGFHGHASLLAAPAVEMSRKLIELCDYFSSFILTHSLGGGTGSGLFSLVSTELRDQFTDKIFSSVSIFPCEKVSDVVVEPYNTVLTMSRLLENIDQTVCLENETLYRICYEKLLIKAPGLDDFNALSSMVSAGFTASSRFPGQINTSMRTTLINLCPYPRIHFLSASFAPIFSTNSEDYVSMRVPELTQQAFDSGYIMTPTDTTRKYLTALLTYRGPEVKTQDCDDQSCRVQAQYSDSFVDFIPNAIKQTIVDVPHVGFPSTCTLLGNHLGIYPWFRRISRNFEVMRSSGAFLHIYTREGMAEEAFEACKAMVDDIVDEVTAYDESADVAVGEDE